MHGFICYYVICYYPFFASTVALETFSQVKKESQYHAVLRKKKICLKVAIYQFIKQMLDKFIINCSTLTCTHRHTVKIPACSGI